MSWIRIWVHLVFSTKNREPYLYPLDFRKTVFAHIKENAKGKDIWIDCINGFNDHVHCLISLGGEQSISKIAQLIKGESSHWININYEPKNKFLWQDDFWAVSVSERDVTSVRRYIALQEEHHKKKSFLEEVDEFMKRYGLSIIKEK